jgi:hypothetical protein
MTGGFSPRSEQWREARTDDYLLESLRSPQDQFAVGTAALASVLVFVLALAAALLTAKQHFSFSISLVAAVIATAAAVGVAVTLGRFRQHQRRPSPAEERAATLRIQAIVSSLLDRYGMEEPEINPPVKLVDVSGYPSGNDLDARLATARATSSEYFLSELAERPGLTFILGDAGSGKTSLLLRLTYRMILARTQDSRENSREPIPLFFKCRDWSDEYGSFRKWITAAALKSYDIPAHLSDYWIRSGQLFIALDGLHEVPLDRLEDFSTSVRTWVEAADGTRLAISSVMRPDLAAAVRLLGVDQLCVIQPLPDADMQRLLRDTLQRLRARTGVPPAKEQQMDIWMRGLISRNRAMRGPALVGLLAAAIEEAGQLPDGVEEAAEGRDPAAFAFRVANSFFSRGDLAAARDAYDAIKRRPHSRWHIQAYTLFATCLYLLGDVEEASGAMMEAVALRLQESIRATPGNVFEPLSEEELHCLAAVPFDRSFDIAQISSAASIPLSRSRQALRTLRERGLVETVAGTDDRARFRRSIPAPSSR